MSPALKAYAKLKARFARISVLGEAMGVLHWDSAVMMPPKGAHDRTEQLATLSGLSHELLVDPGLKDAFSAAADADLDPWDGANLAEMRRLHAHAAALSGDLVEAKARACSKCENMWRTARPASDFNAVKDLLAEVVQLTREEAQAKTQVLGVSPYDALLDQYEPGGSTTMIDPLFDELADLLPDFTDRVLDAQGDAPPILRGPFPASKQEALVRDVMARIGFDFDHGRLDISAHPFCGGVPGDVRVTTRYDEEDFATALMASIHETGHALYERGLPEKWRRQPVGAARGMTLHESQSLLMEMQACRSPEFFRFLAPIARKALAANGEAWSEAAFYRRSVRVERGFIRVDADEVTYPLHVILRYRLEKGLLDGSISVADLPEAWNQGFADLMGVAVPDDACGVLQDIHWYDGAIGYFPTYTLGAIAAAQLFSGALTAEPSILDAIKRGEFSVLNSWTRANVHAKGSSASTQEIVRQATGEPLTLRYFREHLSRRYLPC